jgi:hypothetical protein
MNPQILKPYIGVHCETVATGTLLLASGCELSEPMLFGLGEGLGFVFLNLSSLPLPFLGGRNRPFDLTRNICRNIGVACHEEETSSRSKAWAHLESNLRDSTPVGLQLDCFYLPYFQRAPHFAGHFVAALRMASDEVEVADTIQQGTVQKVSRTSLEQARFARGPMSSRARAYTLSGCPTRKLSEALLIALRNNAKSYLTPPFSGAGASGIEKLARSLPQWLKQSKSPPEDLQLAALLMEKAGTGGALFRCLYRDFLDEAVTHLPKQARILRAARDEIAEAARSWTGIAELLIQAAADGKALHLMEAAAMCRTIAAHELSAMRRLAQLECNLP